MSDSTQKLVIDLIKRSNKILIMPSNPPDGDSIGAAIAFYLVLKKINKEATIICRDEVPDVLQFLPNTKMIGRKIASNSEFVITLDTSHTEIENIKNVTEGDKINIIITPKSGHFSEDNISFNKGKIDYDLIITLDCAELSQLGDIYDNNVELFYQIPVINIDHHISNTHYGKINYIDIMASSTTELLISLFEELGKKENIDLIDEDIATLLLTGIITDTGSFQNANTTPRSFASSANLIAYGARQQEIIQHVYKTKELSQLKLWGRVLSKIQIDEKYKIVWSVVSQQDFKDTESSEEATGDIIDELMTNAPGAEIVLLIKEKEDFVISVSLRTTNPSINASAIAEEFGGGGHARAAGFKINNIHLRDAEYKIINFLKQFQKERLGIIEEEEVIPKIKEPIKKEEIKEEVKEPIKEPVKELAEVSLSEKKVKKINKKPSKTEEPIPPHKEDIPSNISYKFED